MDFELPIDAWVENIVNYILDNFQPLLDGIAAVVDGFGATIDERSWRSRSGWRWPC